MLDEHFCGVMEVHYDQNGEAIFLHKSGLVYQSADPTRRWWIQHPSEDISTYKASFHKNRRGRSCFSLRDRGIDDGTVLQKLETFAMVFRSRQHKLRGG